MQFLSEHIIIIICAIFIIICAFLDWQSHKKGNHKDYKSIIISIGVLGTFMGIFIGLWNFDTESIKDSVPNLLEGLKVAFITSIVGMGTCVLLSFVQKLNAKGEVEYELRALSSIDKQLQKLDILQDIKEGLSVLPLMDNKLDLINKHIQVLSKDVLGAKGDISANQIKIYEVLQANLDEIIQSLNNSIESSEDLIIIATEDITKALQNTMQNFNQNLVGTFKNGFRQLNEFAKDMTNWQKGYQESIKEVENILYLSIEGVQSMEQNIANMAKSYGQIDTTYNKLNAIISANENQIKNIEIHLQKLNDIGQKAELITSSLDTFSDKIKNSLSNQSQMLTEMIKESTILKKEIQRQLPESLGELNRALTSLSDKFRDDYGFFLKHIGEVINIKEKI